MKKYGNFLSRMGLVENIVNNDFPNLLVKTRNRTLSLSICAEMDNLDCDILEAEYINSVNIDLVGYSYDTN